MAKSRKPKEILHSKRGNLEYLEHCRVMVKGGRVLYLTAEKSDAENKFWNVPIANTTAILLGTGTSITQQAVRLLSEAGVMIGFCGTGGTPLISGVEVEWFSPQSEYRPTQYLQAWLAFWFDDSKRLDVAKSFQDSRIAYLRKIWSSHNDWINAGIDVDEPGLSSSIHQYVVTNRDAENVTSLLAAEGRLTKALYKHVARGTGQAEFRRDPDRMDSANRFLNHGNYLAYGLAATCLWCLGIPHGFAVMHGKTRRGALVFDVADLVKDAVVLPTAFMSAANGDDDQQFRQTLLDLFTQHKTLQQMFDVIKNVLQIDQTEENLNEDPSF